MKRGFLSEYFVSVAAKRLGAVEADPGRSNQHEFNGSRKLKMVLGTGTGDPVRFPAKILWIGELNEGISSEGMVTWYDARKNVASRSPEYRLYFPTTDATNLASEGDLMFIAKRPDDTLMIIITAAGSTIENQLLWLFGIPFQTGIKFEMQSIEEDNDVEIDFVVRFILDELEIEVEEPENDVLDRLLEKFEGNFPDTFEFSAYARSTVQELHKDTINPVEEPDNTLMAWMDHEEKLFRRLERHIVARRIEQGFVSQDGTDVDGFIKFSLSVQNRRKSRAGYALEHHLEQLFVDNKVNYSRGAITENKSKPDFIFPDIKLYHNEQFSATLLTMLGVKTSLKDRWRQVLSEAARIDNKHLLTLEPGISNDQTEEMKSDSLQLVLPKPIHLTFPDPQKDWLLSVNDFLDHVKGKQSQEGGVIIL